MIGAIIGDVVGSYHEFRKEKIYDEDLILPESCLTDDSILSLATAESILRNEYYTRNYKRYCKAYPTVGYGPSFMAWAHTHENYLTENFSYGNGAPMRVSPVGWAFDSISRVMMEAQQTACVTHYHPEGIRGAQSVAVAIYMARCGYGKDEIKAVMESYFEYDCDLDLDVLHREYTFDVTSQGTVPVALACVFQAESFEKTLRNGLYVGGDSDTLLAIAGSIAEPLYGVPNTLREQVEEIIESSSPFLLGVLREFEGKYGCGQVIKEDAKWGMDGFLALLGIKPTRNSRA